MKNLLVVILSVLVLLTFSCSKKNDLKKEVAGISKEINGLLVQIRDQNNKNKDFVTDLYNNKDKYDLNIDKMEKEKGGKYTFFKDKAYYKPEDDGKCVFLATGAVKVDDNVKKEIKLLENAEQVLIDSKKLFGDNITYATLFTNNCTSFQYPFRNLISVVPVGLDSTKTPFYVLANETNNPERKNVWTKDPIVDMAGAGWIMTNAAPVYVNGKLMAITFLNTSIEKLSEKYIRENKNILLLVSSSTALLSASTISKQFFDLKELNFFYYLEQLKKNPLVAKEYFLKDENQAQYLQEIAKRFVNEPEFEVVIKNIKYYVVVDKISEVNFYLIGITKK